MSLSAIAVAGAARAAGAAVFAPAFTMIPWRFRLAFAAAAGWAAAPIAAGDAMVTSISLPEIAVEAAIGAMIGLLAAIAVEALRVCGHVIGEQMGLSLAQAYDPAIDGEASSAEALLAWSAITIFVAVGGIQTVAMTAATSVRTLPPGSFFQSGIANSAASLLDAAMLVGFKACLPVVGVLAAVSAVAALVVRIVPGFSTFSAGFGPRAATGLAAAVATCGVMWAAENAFIQDSLARIAREVAP
ncbi:MAG: flagellar biosynthetic protein FliR [Planctomycetes bacterium]|nr:flagellar biosynthetic protein FliR [Planctomycetota bacterium]